MTTPQIALAAALKSATQAEWFDRLIANARALKLRATAWQSGSVARSILQVFSFAFQLQDVAISLIAQGGFLDFAGSGAITYVDATGTSVTVPVTPEGGPGWLDILASSVYAVERIEENFAGGELAITNTSVSTYGPFTAGTYHVSDRFTGQGYTSTVDLTIPPSAVVGTVADIVGYFGLIQVETTAAHGLTDGDVVSVRDALGIPLLLESNGWYVTVRSATEFTLDGSVFAGAYAGGGTVYSPTTTTVQADVAGSVGDSLNGDGVADTNVVTQPVTSLVGVTVANLTAYVGTDTEANASLVARCKLKLGCISPKGPQAAYEFFALSSIQYAPLLVPAQKVASAITRIYVHADAANGEVIVWCANPSGPSSPEDVEVTDAVLEKYATPLAITKTTAAATARNIAVRATVYLPTASNTPETRSLVQSTIQAYFRGIQVGGESDPQGAYTNIVPHETLVGVIFDALEDAGILAENLTVRMNGSSSSVQLVVDTNLLIAEVPVLSPAVPFVELVSA